MDDGARAPITARGTRAPAIHVRQKSAKELLHSLILLRRLRRFHHGAGVDVAVWASKAHLGTQSVLSVSSPRLIVAHTQPLS
eukprot:CAMPEP_0179342022 /NCGR_PEP_ID=MMETSP0797-20121207/70169_1 /TAXON_ID=47934 /ORGANISM="Dinophysis acuminata, Strain DAEP01" /LENGTH=81 /DNA_ID=CAMNT_0021056177 /DNA_START=78 /DNA_END=319 /DNA_ORIENTATION=-